MKKTVGNLLSILAVTTLGSVGLADQNNYGLLDDTQLCTDCYNFVAPSVNDPSAISPIETGLIVHDTSTDTPMMADGSGDFRSLIGADLGPVLAKTGNYTVDVGDGLITVNASGNVDLSLPAASSNKGVGFMFKRNDTSYSASNVVKIVPNGTDKIEGLDDLPLPGNGDFARIVSDGSGWVLLENKISATIFDHSASGHGSTRTKVRYLTSNSVDNSGSVITRTSTATNGSSYEIHLDGTYQISYSDRRSSSSANFSMGIARDVSTFTTNINSQTIFTNRLVITSGQNTLTETVSINVFLKAGTIIYPMTDGMTDSGGDEVSFVIQRL